MPSIDFYKGLESTQFGLMELILHNHYSKKISLKIDKTQTY